MEVLVQLVLSSSFALQLLLVSVIAATVVPATAVIDAHQEQIIESQPTMTSFVWVLSITLLLIVAVGQALSWMPSLPTTVRRENISRRSLQQENNNDNPDQKENGNNNSNKETEQQQQRHRLSQLLPWWEDSWSESLRSSFPVTSSRAAAAYAAMTTTTGGDNNNTTVVIDELAHYSPPTRDRNPTVLHFCFLLHGHRGFSTDLSYLQRGMQHYAELEKMKRSSSSSSDDPQQQQQQQDIIVHCPSCNEGRTTDGVIHGGERLVREIVQVIRTELLERQSTQNSSDSNIEDITISMVGNSLGGIYGRYAISKLAEQVAAMDVGGTTTKKEGNTDAATDDNHNYSPWTTTVLRLDGKYRLHFNIFCTTATPHLGISKHTYVPLPRSAEIGAAYVLGETGRDLFRLNAVLKTMATSPVYLDPLRKFRHRVAYANAYATDFPVPASTAAFLSDDSSYPHHFAAVDSNSSSSSSSSNATTTTTTTTTTSSDDNNLQPIVDEENNDDCIIATLHTRKADPPLRLPTTTIGSGNDGSNSDNDTEESIVDDLVQMSNSLDSLGWKKVFIDVRKEIPFPVSIPKSFRNGIASGLWSAPKRMFSSSSSIGSNTSSNTNSNSNRLEETTAIIPVATSEGNENKDLTTTAAATSQATATATPPQSAMHRLRQKGVVESRDVASMVSTPEDMRLHFPLGHNLMVALSREGITGRMYKGGRPVMDALAKQLVQDIFGWSLEEEHDAAEKALRLASPKRNSKVQQ